MFELNGTAFVFIVMFVVFMFLLNKVFVRPVGQVLEKRANKIKGDYESGRLLRQDAEAVIQRYQKHMDDMRERAQDLINNAITGAQQEKEKEIRKVQAEGLRRLEEVKKSLASEREAALNELVEQEIELVKIISHHLVGEPLIATLDHERVRRALKECS